MRLKSLFTLALFVALLPGCGGGGGANVAVVSKEAEAQPCIGCHAGALSPATGVSIAEEWQGSRHALANAAGCVDCHDPADGHPNLCSNCHGGGGSPSGYEVSRNPDVDGKCAKCHGLNHPNDVMIRNAPQHFGNMTASVSRNDMRASYVSGEYRGRCRACHNPHAITATPQHRAYARSGHGNTTALPFAHYDFKARPDCIRCHTSTGFKQYVASNFTIPTAGFGAPGDLSRGVLWCDTCHASYDYKKSLRKVAAFTAPYNGGKNPGRFPDVGETNLCLPCHAGQETNDSINAIADAAFSNVGFKNPHYLAAAGLMYMKTGFTGFTSASAPIGTAPDKLTSTYGKSLSPDNLSTPDGIVGGTTSAHRKLGTAAINGDSHNPEVFVPGVLDQNGPCVTCHLNGSGVSKRAASGHSLQIDANAYRQVCINCHTSENAIPLAADGSNFKAIFLEPQAEAFELSLDLMQHLLLTRYGIRFDQSLYPYFFDEAKFPGQPSSSATQVKDWTRSGTVNGRKLMGACFNFNLLKREPAAYAHARSFSRRLIYDSIDFLDDGVMNWSVSTTAVNSGLTLHNGAPVFFKDANAYNTANGTISTIYGSTSEAMLYLVGWSRSTGKWNAIERP